MSFVENTQEVVEQEEVAAEAPQKKKRGKKHVDENGEPVAKAPRKKAEPKLDEEGNPIPRAPRTRIIPNDEGAIIFVSEEQMAKIANYKGQRASNAAMIRDGMTLGDFYAAGGDRGFLAFYVRDKAVTLG